MITGNDSSTLVYYVLVTFSDLEEQKHIITCLYNITLAHVSSVNIKEKPYKATLILEKGMCSMLGEGGGWVAARDYHLPEIIFSIIR